MTIFLQILKCLPYSGKTTRMECLTVKINYLKTTENTKLPLKSSIIKYFALSI